MKRDLDLCLQILRHLENQPAGRIQLVYDTPEEVAHVGLLVDAGLLVGRVFPGQPSPGGTAIIKAITWAGHDFLDASFYNLFIPECVNVLTFAFISPTNFP